MAAPPPVVTPTAIALATAHGYAEKSIYMHLYRSESSTAGEGGESRGQEIACARGTSLTSRAQAQAPEPRPD